MIKELNIVFIFTDDQRFDTINALGNPNIITPNLDRLVASGTAFTNAHIPCGTSAAVCMPSRAMLHTGRSLFNIHKQGQEIPEEHTTMGMHFKENGYNTIGIGKWHNGTSSYARSFTDGSEIYFGGSTDHWNIPTSDYDPTGKYDNVINFTYNAYLSNETAELHCDHITPGKHSTDLFGDCAVDYIGKQESHIPFFMYLAFFAPHDPRTMPDKYKEMYNIDDIELPANYMEQHPFDYGVSDIRDEILADYPRTKEEIREHILEYYAMITHLDHNIGKILDSLEENCLMDNTIIVFASDNGLAVGQHGLMGKQSIYEHSIRVPLVLAGKGIPKNQKSSAYVYLYDIFPTLCELTGTAVPDTVNGISFNNIIDDNEAVNRDIMYFAYTDLVRGVKDSQYKLVEYAPGNGKRYTQLFDFVNDPDELYNLYTVDGYEEIISRLRLNLYNLRDEWNDTTAIIGENGENFWLKYR